MSLNNIIWLIFLLLRELFVGWIQYTYSGYHSLMSLRLPHFCLAALISLAVIPHGAYALSCCLLE